MKKYKHLFPYFYYFCVNNGYLGRFVRLTYQYKNDAKYVTIVSIHLEIGYLLIPNDLKFMLHGVVDIL